MNYISNTCTWRKNLLNTLVEIKKYMAVFDQGLQDISTAVVAARLTVRSGMSVLALMLMLMSLLCSLFVNFLQILPISAGWFDTDYIYLLINAYVVVKTKLNS